MRLIGKDFSFVTVGLLTGIKGRRAPWIWRNIERRHCIQSICSLSRIGLLL
jgi:hypothetical protein